MIYLRCPFCDEVCGRMEGSGILTEPIANYYTYIKQGGDLTLNIDTDMHNINGLIYFPHIGCYTIHLAVEERRKKLTTLPDV